MTASGGMSPESIKNFCDPEEHGRPEFWAYYCAYDWVVLCQLYGPMIGKPKGWPMRCNDLAQYCYALGNPHMDKLEETDAHNALVDAKWCRDAWRALREYEGRSS